MFNIDKSASQFLGRSSGQIRCLIFSSVMTVFLLLLWEGRLGYGLLWEDGFLWYGSQRVMLGEVPLRDFMSTDPARYYWSAVVMSVLGDNGILANRLALSLFQILGLFFGLWAITPVLGHTRVIPITLAAVILGLWMNPICRAFDFTISILLVATLAYVVDQPTHRHFFLLGLIVGIAACFGRNHGIYGVTAGLLAFCYLRVDRDILLWSRFFYWALGIILGYLPVLMMVLFIPGFGHALWESIRFLFEYKGTNLSLPIPWPWVVDLKQPWIDGVRHVVVGLFFVLILGYGVVSLLILARSAVKKKPLTPMFVASAILALPYAHYAYSRADVAHLSLGIFPFLLGLLFFLMRSHRSIRILGTLGLCVATAFSALTFHPGWVAQRAGNWPVIEVAGDVLRVDPSTANSLNYLKMLISKYAPNGRELIVTPYWPGAYAAFGRKSPMWENYALFPRSETFQKAEIRRIENLEVGFILILDFPLDQREELRFRYTHPLIDRFIRETFVPAETNASDNSLRLYLNRQVRP